MRKNKIFVNFFLKSYNNRGKFCLWKNEISNRLYK